MKKFLLLLIIACSLAFSAEIGVTKTFYINDTEAFRTIQWYEATGRFVPKGVQGGFAVFDVFQVQTGELKFMYANWSEIRVQKLDVWAVVPASALNSNVPAGFSDRLNYDENGDPVSIKTWAERSNYIIKHDDPSTAIISMSPKDANNNNLASGNTAAMVKQFIDLVVGIGDIDDIYSGTGIQSIKAVYLPPVIEE